MQNVLHGRWAVGGAGGEVTATSRGLPHEIFSVMGSSMLATVISIEESAHVRVVVRGEECAIFP